jgi:hypothetical protein
MDFSCCLLEINSGDFGIITSLNLIVSLKLLISLNISFRGFILSVIDLISKRKRDY